MLELLLILIPSILLILVPIILLFVFSIIKTHKMVEKVKEEEQVKEEKVEEKIEYVDKSTLLETMRKEEELNPLEIKVASESDEKVEENADFEFKEVVITEDDFQLVQAESKIYDEKLGTKPTTFMKDALRRFCKNKSSVVGAAIIGLIILLAIVVPMVSPYDVDKTQIYTKLLPPKLFSTGTGFWDGTKKYTDFVYDIDNEVPADLKKDCVVKISEPKVGYINSYSKYAKGGTFIFANKYSSEIEEDAQLYHATNVYFNQEDNIIVTIKLSELQQVNDYKAGEYRIVLLEYVDSESKVQKLSETDESDENETEGSKENETITTDYAEKLVLKDYSTEYGEITINISQAMRENNIENFTGRFCIELKQNEYEVVMGQVLGQAFVGIESLEFKTNSKDASTIKLFDDISIKDANQTVGVSKEDKSDKYWQATGNKELYQAEAYLVDFTYDWYKDKLGVRTTTIGKSSIDEYIDNGWLEFDYSYNYATGECEITEFTVLNSNCPIEEIHEITYYDASLDTYQVSADITEYKRLGYNKMPKFILGTDDSGYDLITLCFKGLRTSLLIAFASSAVCFIFGLCWGAISGYFGGNVDLIMERFCDILGGIPWIVMMTLAILLLGNNILTFALALCLTGWMGTAARTRTQFYRFKGREYILASRTLGAGDFRLIFKHILPNAMGTIITSSVLMIPSTIFSETTLSYLNLGLQGSNSFGNILSRNQAYISTYPVLIVFPAIIISLIMISFNLFGNGLRDAFNPSLKGSE